MRILIVLTSLLFAVNVSAQIVLEHTYSPNGQSDFPGIRFALVDSNDVKFFRFSGASLDTMQVYNSDHSLYKAIPIPSGLGSNINAVFYLSKHLFNLDDKLEVMIQFVGPTDVAVINEDGNVLFECKKCALNYPLQSGTGAIPESIVNTQYGTKLILTDSLRNIQVYSLPGKLPGSSLLLGVPQDPTSIVQSSDSPTAYPNPSNGSFTVKYSLPVGVSTGDLVITTPDGREIRRYQIGSAFNDLNISNSDLPSGAYFYKVVTSAGESKAEKLIVIH